MASNIPSKNKENTSTAKSINSNNHSQQSLSQKEIEDIRKKISEPVYIKILKILILVIPLAIILYLFASNFLISKEFFYFFDIGSTSDSSSSTLSPVNRISTPFSINTDNFRNITSALVYFNLPIMQDSSNANIQIKFNDNFPNNTKMYLGTKNKEEWSYSQYLIYSKTIEDMIEKYAYTSKDGLILIKLNNNAPLYSIDQINRGDFNTVVATTQNIPIQNFQIPSYTPSEITVKQALRGNHQAFFYAKGDLTLTIRKKDLNWYENEDILFINIYDANNLLIANYSIEDDGEDDKKLNKTSDNEQKINIFIPALKEGVYRLELKNNADMLITQITMNQNKLIFKDPIFIASSDVYFANSEKTQKIFFKSKKDLTLKFLTYHKPSANQTIRVDYRTLKLDSEQEDFFIFIPEEDVLHSIYPQKSNLIISQGQYYSFSEEEWFMPFNLKVIDYKEDVNYLKNNADYVLVSYTPVKDFGNGFKIASLNFSLNQTYVKDEKLNILINIPHLNEDQNLTKSKYIAIDWINASVYRPAKISI